MSPRSMCQPSVLMSLRTDRNKRLVRAYMDAMNSPEGEGPFRYVSRRFHLSGGVLTGDFDLPGAIAWRNGVLRAFPDLQIHVDPKEIVAEDDSVAVKVRWTATHRNAYRGVPGSSRKVDISMFALFRIRNGLIESETHLTDSLALMEQIKGDPPPHFS